MSSIYIQEPPTSGKVLLHTTVGDIDVELWSKETPKACRNFIQLCLEGYYDGTVFHRLVPGFITQGGDPTGTGMGGESIYGKTFKDEFHTRLRFVRRGLVAMANAGKDDNGSQFFFTLGPCPELQSKHTIFGKVTGNTLYNMLKLEESMVDQNERPLYPHKIISTKVLVNSFSDIIPRTTPKSEKQSTSEEQKPQSKGTKNFSLLSFGEEAEEEEAEVDAVAKEFRGKSKSSHDLTNDPKLSSIPAVEKTLSGDVSTNEKRKGPIDQDTMDDIKKKLKKDTVEPPAKELSKVDKYYHDKAVEEDQKREEVRREIKKLKREINTKEKPVKEQESDEPKITDEDKGDADNALLKQFHQDLVKFKEIKVKQPKKGAGREAQTMALLTKFQSKLQAVKEKVEVAKPVEDQEDGELEKDDDDDDELWLGHVLKFEEQGPIVAKDANTKNVESYELSDPRNPLNMRRRETSKKIMTSKKF